MRRPAARLERLEVIGAPAGSWRLDHPTGKKCIRWLSTLSAAERWALVAEATDPSRVLQAVIDSLATSGKEPDFKDLLLRDELREKVRAHRSKRREGWLALATGNPEPTGRQRMKIVRQALERAPGVLISWAGGVVDDREIFRTYFGDPAGWPLWANFFGVLAVTGAFERRGLLTQELARIERKRRQEAKK